MDGGVSWTASTTQPHGYRSSVAFHRASGAWITVGPNGSDISSDNGRNWMPLQAHAEAGDAPDANKNWNALSLPFAAGPKGRIGRLRTGTLKPQP